MTFKTLVLFNFIATMVTGNVLDKNITIDSLSILKSPSVHMKNESAVFEKINAIVSQGADKLQFITDFDKTLTKQYYNDVKSLHSYEILIRTNIPQSNSEIYNAALSRYNAIEFDPTIEEERRHQVTSELYKTVHEQVKGIELSRLNLGEVIRKYGPPFRNRSDELLLKLTNLHVPTVILSAGLGDVIEEQLSQADIPFNNISIIANYLKFNGTMMDGLQNHENVINAFNKHQHLNEYLNSDALKNRKNIILMGDYLGDATMASGFESRGTVLKIGFFYNKTEDSLKVYKDTFDIVLNNDQTMNVILDILNLL